MADDYPYIRANGRRWASNPGYIEKEVQLARSDKAPADAWCWIQKHGEARSWLTISELERQSETDINAANTLRKLKDLMR